MKTKFINNDVEGAVGQLACWNSLLTPCLGNLSGRFPAVVSQNVLQLSVSTREDGYDFIEGEHKFIKE